MIYMNDPGHEVPENHILVVPHSLDIPENGYYNEVIMPLAGESKRDWFNAHFYYCLPINIGNQYGFVIKSLVDFDATWPGGEADAIITIHDNSNDHKQTVKSGFGSGIITIQNRFALKTPLGINLMTIQPPNMFVPACVAMTGVIETDQIRRDFTFNLKMTLPNHKVEVRKGDALGAFIPVPRNFVENFRVVPAVDVFHVDIVKNDIEESATLSNERQTVDLEKPHMSGRRYFNGNHTDGTRYPDHQKRVSSVK
jgi:hypothetical protein